MFEEGSPGIGWTGKAEEILELTRELHKVKQEDWQRRFSKSAGGNLKSYRPRNDRISHLEKRMFFLKSAFRKGSVDRSQEGIHSLVGRNESN